MADDGMVINFDLGDGPLHAKPAFRGGSWKDRLTAKKSAQYHRAKVAKRANGGLSKDDQAGIKESAAPEVSSEPRPAKKQRVEGDARHFEDSNSNAVHKQHTSSAQKPRQVISSLFSFNPEAKTATEEPQEDANAPAVPSNAPLQSELDTFTSLGLSTTIAEHLLKKLEIKAPTAIQREAVTQLVLHDTDAFIQAETGSGKTLAYLLPIVQRIASLTSPESSSSRVGRGSGLFAIILAPTRELSKQISVVLEGLLRCAHWIVSGTVIGGEKKKSEKARLRKGLNILIATPGRLADHLDHTEVLDVSNVRWLVLDEGDRLVELGFEKDIQKIVSTLNMRKSRKSNIPALPLERTTVLCSATMKMNVQKLGEISLRNAVHIKASAAEQGTHGKETEEGKFSAPAQLKQSYAIVPAKLRLVSLLAVLKRAFTRKGSVMKTIVFMSCADSVDFHFEVFSRGGFEKAKDDAKSDSAPTEGANASSAAVRTGGPAPSISSKDCPVQVFRLHGSLPQPVRTSTLAAYTKCKDPAVLVCTDVASRGLDLPNVDFVIEYDPPFNKDDHLHRIGRTARAGNDGRAMIFLMPGSEESYVGILKDERRDGGRDVTRHDCNDILKKGFTSTGLGGDKDWEQRATDWQLDVERWAIDNPQHLEQARRGYQSHIRAYSTHVAAERHIFDMKELHLGHLAKAFALRDRPGSIRVPGLRPNANASKSDRRASGKLSSKDHGGEDVVDVDAQEAARKMRAKIKTQLSGSSEFNIG